LYHVSCGPISPLSLFDTPVAFPPCRSSSLDLESRRFTSLSYFTDIVLSASRLPRALAMHSSHAALFVSPFRPVSTLCFSCRHSAFRVLLVESMRLLISFPTPSISSLSIVFLGTNFLSTPSSTLFSLPLEISSPVRSFYLHAVLSSFVDSIGISWRRSPVRSSEDFALKEEDTVTIWTTFFIFVYLYAHPPHLLAL
jgi:hypothetical protein